MIVSALNLPDAPHLVCGLCGMPVTEEPLELEENVPCGHLAETHRVCMTWAISGDCRCGTAFHDTARVVSAKLPWLATLVIWHIMKARGE